MQTTTDTQPTRAELIDFLRKCAKSEHFKENLLIPDRCEKYGFAKGYHNLQTMVQFFADIMED